VFDLLVAVRAVHFAATISACGAILFRFLIAEPVFARAAPKTAETLRAQWSLLVWASLIVAVLSSAAWLVLFTADAFGAPISEVCLHGGVFTVIAQTRFGQAWIVRIALCTLLALSLTSPVFIRWRAVPIAIAAVLLASPAWTGHAGATAGLSGRFHLTADVLHLLAAGAWVGALPPLVLVLATAQRNRANKMTAAITSRFSVMGIVCVGTLLITGIVNSWYLVGNVDNLFSSSYGRLVLLKIAVFAAMVAIAAINRFRLTPKLRSPGIARQLARNALTETGLGLIAIFLAAALGSMEPAAHSHPTYAPVPAGAAFVHIHTEQAMADVTVTPGRAALVTLELRLVREDFTPLKATQVSVRLSDQTTGQITLNSNAVAAGDGSWRVEGLDLPHAGTWTVWIDVSSDEYGRISLDGPIVIEP
jgi:putative copper resistance protein D